MSTLLFFLSPSGLALLGRAWLYEDRDGGGRGGLGSLGFTNMAYYYLDGISIAVVSCFFFLLTWALFFYGDNL